MIVDLLVLILWIAFFTSWWMTRSEIGDLKNRVEELARN